MTTCFDLPVPGEVSCRLVNPVSPCRRCRRSSLPALPGRRDLFLQDVNCKHTEAVQQTSAQPLNVRRKAAKIKRDKNQESL